MWGNNMNHWEKWLALKRNIFLMAIFFNLPSLPPPSFSESIISSSKSETAQCLGNRYGHTLVWWGRPCAHCEFTFMCHMCKDQGKETLNLQEGIPPPSLGWSGKVYRKGSHLQSPQGTVVMPWGKASLRRFTGTSHIDSFLRQEVFSVGSVSRTDDQINKAYYSW